MKKIIKFIPLFILFASLASCGEQIGSSTQSEQSKSSESSSSTDSNNLIKYKINVKIGDVGYPGSGYKVILENKSSTYSGDLLDDGTCVVEAPEGEYYAHLDKTPSRYTYDPNTTIINSSNPECTIQLYNKGKTTGGNGTDKFSNAYTIDNLTQISEGNSYFYTATLTSASQVVYYEFVPKVAGTYKIESCVDMFDNEINPVAIYYNPGSTNTSFGETKVDNGGNSFENGFTKNFAFTSSFTERQIGNVQKFGIRAEVNGIDYPVDVTFKISLIGDATQTLVKRNIVYATELYYKRDSNGTYLKDSNGNYIVEYEKISEGASDHFSEDYDATHNTLYFNQAILGNSFSQSSTNYYYKRRYSYSNGEYILDPTGDYVLKAQVSSPEVTSNYQELYNSSLMSSGGKTVLDSTKCFLNEEDGYWYVNTSDGAKRLCATINSATHYIENAITHLEDDGGTGVSAMASNEYTSDGKRVIYNWKRFIEAEYSDACDSSGRAYVTDELKTFLQKLSNNNQYFFDGNGWCEADGTYADEDSQWLFVCGFYY